MKRFLFFCTAAFCIAPAMAGELFAHHEGDYVRLAEEACANEAVLRRVEPEEHASFRAASAVVHGQTFLACWRVTPLGAHLLYEDGDEGIVPFRKLRELLTI